VPLFVDTGEDETVENDNLVGLMDLAPTLADKADVDRPETYRGQPLSQVEDQWNRSEVIAEWADTDTDDRRFAVRTTNWKYIREENGAEQLYDLTADPEEMNDLATGNPNVLSDLRETLEDHLATLDESREDLGDVEMDGGAPATSRPRISGVAQVRPLTMYRVLVPRDIDVTSGALLVVRCHLLTALGRE